MSLKLAAQEQMLHGETLVEKWAFAQSVGFDGIELRGEGEGRFTDRLPDIRAAVDAGAAIPTVCVMMDHFIGDFDAERRRDAVDNMKILMSVIAQAGGLGAITPATYGMFSRALPPFTAPRSPEQDREVLLPGQRDGWYLADRPQDCGRVWTARRRNREGDEAPGPVRAAGGVRQLGQFDAHLRPMGGHRSGAHARLRRLHFAPRVLRR